MDEEGALFDSGFDDVGPFRGTPESGGVSLESALRAFGPAAIDDLIPRVRAIARALDAAHARGVVHGALHPKKVLISDDATRVLAGTRSVPPFDSAQGKPYIAPEVAGGGAPAPAADQFALAAITFEWLFGRPISGPAERPVDVRTMPGVDRVALSKAFTRALAPLPANRFASCADFCDALLASTTPELPFDSERKDAFLAQGGPFGSQREDAFLAQGEPLVDDLKITTEESILTAAPPDLDPIDPGLSSPPPALASWNPSAAVPQAQPSPRFSAFALILGVMVGAVFGFAAGYMARPRALQSTPPQEFAAAPGTENEVAAPKAPAPAPEAPAPKARQAPQAPKLGRILVRSTPSGATVSVDGTERGVTPLALREVDAGTRTVTIARRGYISETRKVLITKARPARTLDVRLAAEATASASAAGGRSGAILNGSLAIESRPAGAAVAINGKPSGKTPMTITDLAPGEYRITMTLPGYRNFATTVRVVAGERARAAASLTAQENE